MSTRLGRNPLQASKKPAKKTSKIIEEMMAEPVETAGSPALEKPAPRKTSVARAGESESAKSPKTSVEKLLRWLLVDIPADSYVFALKSVLLIKAVLD
jgi:hypothetical protein